mgnify:CR=1 FL=1
MYANGTLIEEKFGDKVFEFKVPLSGDKGLVAPPRLVDIEAVFFDLPVEGDDALVVHPRFAPLVPGVGGEVEHIPCGYTEPLV